MTREELIAKLSDRFYDNFAEEMAMQIATAEDLAMLYALITSEVATLPRAVRHKVLFRGAYVVEKIYFDSPKRFLPHREAFCRRDFVACGDASARRHFGKIMAYVLRDYVPDQQSLEAIAETAAEWAVDPMTKPAVRIWAMDVLMRCRERVEWVAEGWEDLVVALSHDAPPSILCRLRRDWGIHN